MQKSRSNAMDNNDLVKFTCSTEDNSATNDSTVMKIAQAELYTISNIVCNVEFSTCNTVGLSLDNNNSVKFTSSRGDNSTTNDVVMKIAHAQLCINFRAVHAKLWEKSSGQNCVHGQTDGWTDRQI